MKFSDAVDAGYKNYFNFSGAAGRSEYWWFFLWYILLWLVGGLFLGAFIAVNQHNHTGALVMGGIAALFGLAALGTIIPTLSIQVRRLHDTGHSGWWVGGSLLLSAIRGALHAMARYNPSPGLHLGLLALALVWLGVNIAIFVFLVQPSRGGGYSRY